MRKVPTQADTGDARRTSMGPQLDSCGRGAERSAAPSRACTSMGPQLDSCGRPRWLRVHSIWSSLQWGRNLTVAEGLLRRILHIAFNVLQWGRNLTVAEGSHGPHRPRRHARLQWGRNLTVAEGHPQSPRQARQALTSMGPQLDSCGRCLASTERGARP